MLAIVATPYPCASWSLFSCATSTSTLSQHPTPLQYARNRSKAGHPAPDEQGTTWLSTATLTLCLSLHTRSGFAFDALRFRFFKGLAQQYRCAPNPHRRQEGPSNQLPVPTDCQQAASLRHMLYSDGSLFEIATTS